MGIAHRRFEITISNIDLFSYPGRPHHPRKCYSKNFSLSLINPPPEKERKKKGLVDDSQEGESSAQANPGMISSSPLKFTSPFRFILCLSLIHHRTYKREPCGKFLITVCIVHELERVRARYVRHTHTSIPGDFDKDFRWSDNNNSDGSSFFILTLARCVPKRCVWRRQNSKSLLFAVSKCVPKVAGPYLVPKVCKRECRHSHTSGGHFYHGQLFVVNFNISWNDSVTYLINVFFSPSEQQVSGHKKVIRNFRCCCEIIYFFFTFGMTVIRRSCCCCCSLGKKGRARAAARRE
jgi:hypothetical protein